MTLTVAQLVLVTAIVIPGAWIQGSVGFGWALAASPLLALVDTAFIPGPMLLASTLLAVLIGLRDRASVDTRGVSWALAGRVPGSILGAITVAALSPTRLGIVFAAVVLVAVAGSLIAPRFGLRRRALVVAGALSGLMGTATAIGGPPLALLYQHAGGSEMRGTLSAFFVVGGLISLVSLGAVGELGRTDVDLALALSPGVVLGFAASHFTRGWFDAGRVRPAVLIMATVSAVLLLVRQLA